jgi:capsular polysaccharide transport system permease protein
VTDYLLSHDAVARLRREDGLVQRFRRSAIDFISALKSDDPTPEKLLKYYRKQIAVEQNLESGISEIKVRAFTPQDAYAISSKLLEMGEERVNQINERSMRGQVSSAQSTLSNAENELAKIQQRITLFRQKRGDIDPAGSGKAQIELVSQLTANLASARARLNSLRGFISPSSPQYRAIQAQVEALQRQVELQNSRLAGTGNNIAVGLGAYEDLVVRQDFAAKRYAAAAAALDEARAQALRQQIYLVRVVDPNMPVKSLYPERGRITITVFMSLLIAYGIGWLMLAGVREHKM